MNRTPNLANDLSDGNSILQNALPTGQTSIASPTPPGLAENYGEKLSIPSDRLAISACSIIMPGNALAGCATPCF